MIRNRVPYIQLSEKLEIQKRCWGEAGLGYYVRRIWVGELDCKYQESKKGPLSFVVNKISQFEGDTLRNRKPVEWRKYVFAVSQKIDIVSESQVTKRTSCNWHWRLLYQILLHCLQNPTARKKFSPRFSHNVESPEQWATCVLAGLHNCKPKLGYPSYSIYCVCVSWLLHCPNDSTGKASVSWPLCTTLHANPSLEFWVIIMIISSGTP